VAYIPLDILKSTLKDKTTTQVERMATWTKNDNAKIDENEWEQPCVWTFTRNEGMSDDVW